MTYIDKPVVPKVVKLEEPTAKERKVLNMMLNTGSDIYQGACKNEVPPLRMNTERYVELLTWILKTWQNWALPTGTMLK